MGAAVGQERVIIGQTVIGVGYNNGVPVCI